MVQIQKIFQEPITIEDRTTYIIILIFSNIKILNGTCDHPTAYKTFTFQHSFLSSLYHLTVRIFKML